MKCARGPIWALIGLVSILGVAAALADPPDSAPEAGTGSAGETAVDLDLWRGAPPAPLPPRADREDGPAAPAGLLLTHDPRTGRTSSSAGTGTGAPAASMDFTTGLNDGSVPIPQDKNFNAYSLVPDPTLPPYRNKVKLFMRYYTATDTLYYVGSGTLIGPRTVLTAGHCVYHDGIDWYDEVVVVPAYNFGNEPYGRATAENLHAWSGWTGSQDWDHDVGVITLDRPLGTLTGWVGYGYNSDCDFYKGGSWVHSDYPAADPFDGQSMQTATGNYDGCEIFGNEVDYDRRGYGGASGGGSIRKVDGSEIVWAVRSNTDHVIWNSWDCRLTQGKYADIQGWIADLESPSLDFEPIQVELGAANAAIGYALPAMTFQLTNKGPNWLGWFDFDVYLSTDSDITTSDLRLGSYTERMPYSIGAQSYAREVVVDPPTIPTTVAAGNYYVGVIITTPDYDASNNDTDGVDAARITLSCLLIGGADLVAPADGTECLPVDVTLDWDPVPGADYYEVDLSRTGSLQQFTVANDSLSLTGLYPNRLYSWRVRAYNPCGNAAMDSPTWQFTTEASAPPPASLLSPADQSVCQPVYDLFLDWSGVGAAEDYRLQVGTSCGSGSMYITPSTYKYLNGLSPGTEYHWRVETRTACGEGTWSDCRSFTTAEALGPLEGLRSPFLGQDNVTDPAHLDWYDLEGADGYRVEYWPEGGSVTTVNTVVSELEIDGIIQDQKYYWRARGTTDCGGLGPWNPTWHFFTIGPGPDLTLVDRAGWAHPVVPRPLADASPTSVPAPVILQGDTTLTYWNLSGVNQGAVGTTLFGNHIRVDGAYTDNVFMMNSDPGEEYTLYNRGPVRVRGGRHTFGGLADGNGQIVETDEGNNGAAKQWVWRPSFLLPESAVTRAEPPDRTGGHEHLPPIDPFYYNCDGMRVIATGWWNAYVLSAAEADADYDFGLTYPAAGTQSGFDQYLTGSVRPAGCTEVVLVNTNVTGDQTEEFDAGVYRQAGGGDYTLQHVTSSWFPYGTTAGLSLPADQMLLLREIHVLAADVGKVSVIVDADPAEGPLHVAWFDRTLEWGGTHNAVAIGTTDADGHVAIEADVTAAGYHGLAIYRDLSGGTGPRELILRVGAPPGDLVASTPAGWHAPIVPAAGPVFPYPFDVVSAPTTLIGDTLATHYYAHVANEGFGASGDYGLTVGRDGVASIEYAFSSLDPGQDYSFQGNFLTFPAGLHTITLQIDRAGAVFEAWESNNDYGEQWAWGPVVHLEGLPGYRNAPPPRDGGRGTLPAGTVVYDNCDGLRTPLFDPSTSRRWIAATAIVPTGSASDYELRLFDRSDDPATAFRAPRAVSGTGAGATEFVFMPLRTVLERQWDVGVVNVSGNGSYLYETVTGPDLGRGPAGDFGPFTMAPTEVLDIYEAYLFEGYHSFTVRSDSGSVDWGLAIADAAEGYTGKMGVLVDGEATGLVNDGGPGQDEQVTLSIPAPGRYVLGVWKTGATEIQKRGRYTLNIDPLGLAGAGERELPGQDPILGRVWPNPFNPLTNIAFRLAETGRVVIAIYDARGHRVRVLVDGIRPGGEHEVVWDGRDEQGRSVVSGVYFVGLRADDARDTRKITLVR